MTDTDSDSSDRRPSPDALLVAASRERRGKLKIFLGAAPGVGKTYQMLETARRRKAEGVDVVVGVVETHGRSETAALLDGLEAVSRRRFEHRGRTLDEMDIDALLARRPGLALVDELAHTNAPGSRHPKRHHDVEELLEAGIDVFATLNVQHIESLNDVVAKITRIRVRETVPDSVVDGADEIELVDLTPDDLIRRLNEGKVYVREQAQRALRHYFKPGNLTALRELALRRTADRVDEQMRTYMRAHAIEGPWAAGERVLVCLDPSSGAEDVVRAARRIADRLHAPLLALYVETERHLSLSEEERRRLASAQRLAQRLGGETLTRPGRRVAEEVVAFCRERNVTRVVLGKSRRSRWFELRHGSVVDELVRSAAGFSVEVAAAEGGGAPEPRPWGFDGIGQRAAVEGGLALAIAIAAGRAIDELFALPNISLVFVVPILVAAVRHGIATAVAVAAASTLAFNFFFLPPLYTFTIADPANVLALFFFLAIAVVAGALAGGVRAQAVRLRAEARTNADLYEFSRKLVGVDDLDDLLWTVSALIARLVKVEVVILMPDGDGPLAVRGAFPPEDRLEDADLAAARWAWDHDTPAGRGADTLPGAPRLFLPIRTGRARVAVLGVLRHGDDGLDPAHRRLLEALGDQAAIAIERLQLAADVASARVDAERERIRSAMLTSISHDLRTPLASIIGALSSIRSFGERYDASVRADLLATAHEEAERLDRFVGNLLDMTRLDAGAVSPSPAPVDVGDLMSTALRRAAPLLAGRRAESRVEPGLPPARADFVLAEQALFNLLDNAAKYTPGGTAVEVVARRDGDRVEVIVRDEGPGVAPDALPHLFDKFYRANAGDRKRPGTGLGLAIARGFAEVQGGSLTVRNRTDRRGAEFALRLPAAPDALPHTEDD